MKPFKTLIAPVVIAALAITGVSAAQARADSNDVAKFVFGAVALAAIANAIDNSHKSTATVSSNQRYYPYAGRVVDNRQRYEERHRYEERMRHELSAQCLMTYREHRRGTRQLYEGWCLERSNPHLAKLPKQCAVRVVEHGGRNRVAYDPRCLTRYGFNDKGQHRDWRGNDRTYRPQAEAQTYDSRRYGHIAYGN